MIDVRAITKNFGSIQVIKNASFSVQAGRSAAIIGPSGAGKSTLLKILSGLMEPDEGTVTIASQNIGMLFEKNALFDSLTVLENLQFPLMERTSLRGMAARTKCLEYLERVGLKGNQDLFPDEISGGMQKRLGIARALVVNPEVIFYDNPTAGLDPITSKSIASLIQELHAANKTTDLTVTNDILRAFQVADQIFFLADGILFEAGTPEQVRQTNDPALKQFIYGLKEGPLALI